VKRRILVAGLVLSMSGVVSSTTRAETFNVTVSTAPIQGESGFVTFDFIGGDPGQNNTAVVLAFSSDAVLGSFTTSGGALGTLVSGPLTLSDANLLNEWNQSVTFGSTISFQLSLTTNTVTGGIADEFSFFLLDSNGAPFVTSDPTGADSLFDIDVNSPSPLNPIVFTSSSGSATVETTLATRTPTLAPTQTPTASNTATATASVTPSSTPTATFTVTATDTSTATPTLTPTATASNTPTTTAIPTAMPSSTPTATLTSTYSPTVTATSTPPPTDTATATPSATLTSTEIPTPSETPPPCPTPTPVPCVGDCDGSGQVTIDEILTMVNIALGSTNISSCLAGDSNHDSSITIDEILTAVNNALNGCLNGSV